MKSRKSSCLTSCVTVALACCLGIAATACTEVQPSATNTVETGGTTANGGQGSSTTGKGVTSSQTGGKSSSLANGSGGSSKGGTTNADDSPAAGGEETGAGGKSSAGGKSGVGGKTSAGGNSANLGGTTAGGEGESTCVQGIKTGDTCHPSVDVTECVRSTRSCTCEESGQWNCVTTSGGGGATGAGGATAASGKAGAGGKTGVGGISAAGGKTGVGGVTGTGGTTGVGGATTAGSQPTNEFCPASEPCRISPLGDSITEGMGWTPSGASSWGGGYRVKLFSLAIKDGKNFTFVGTRSNGPSTVDSKPFPQKHEGTSGITIEDLTNNVVGKGALTGSAVKPHIILLHIGTNNMYGTHTAKPEVFLATLLDKIIKDCPDALLVVSTLIPLPMNTSGIQDYNAKIPALVDERAKAGAHIVLVDQFKGFPTSELGDQVHPNEAGYARMADVWYKAISQYLH